MDPISLKPKKRESDEFSMVMPAMASDECCPTVYLSGGKELADLPDEGTITFKFSRKELTMRDGDDKPIRMTLSLEAILDAVAETEDAEEEDDDLEMDAGEALDRKFKKAVGSSDEDEEIED